MNSPTLGVGDFDPQMVGDFNPQNDTFFAQPFALTASLAPLNASPAPKTELAFAERRRAARPFR